MAKTLILKIDEGGKKPPEKRKKHLEFRLVFKGPSRRIAEKIIEIAKKEKLKPTTLVRKWVLEKLEEYERAGEAGA